MHPPTARAMLRSLAHALLPLLAATALGGELAAARRLSKAEVQAKQAEAAARIRANMPRASGASSSGVKNITFTNPRASGTHAPLPHTAHARTRASVQSFTSTGRPSPTSTGTLGRAGLGFSLSAATRTTTARCVPSATCSAEGGS